MAPKYQKFHRPRNYIFLTMCCFKEFFIAITFIFAMFNIIQRDECMDIKRDIDLRMNVDIPFYIKYTNSTSTIGDMSNIKWLIWTQSPNTILGIHQDPSIQDIWNYPDPIYYDLTDYFLKTPYYLFTGNEDITQNAKHWYNTKVQNTTMYNNEITWSSDKMLSWTVLRYLNTSRYLYYFTKPISTIDFRFQLSSVKQIKNTTREYRLDDVYMDDIPHGNVTVKYDDFTDSHYSFFHLYNRTMWS